MLNFLILFLCLPVVEGYKMDDGESPTEIYRILYRILIHILALWLVMVVVDFISFRRGRSIERDRFEMFVDAFLANSGLYGRVSRPAAYQSLWKSSRASSGVYPKSTRETSVK